MRPRGFLCFIAVIWATLAGAQDVAFVKAEVEVLAHPDMAGRGYVLSGSQKAARYLGERFDDLGLDSVDKGRFQNFVVEVNTFPERTILVFDGDTLTAGVQYLVDPRSGSSRGAFGVAFLDSADFAGRTPSKPTSADMAVIDTRGIGGESLDALYAYVQDALNSAPVVLLKADKLTWSVGRNQFPNVLLEVDGNSVDWIVPQRIDVAVDGEMKTVEVSNVIGKIKGSRSDSAVFITAHYDHLGMMGEALFAGASDNATGTAVMLDLAAHYSQHPPVFDTWFIAFAAEEAGLLGSIHFVKNPPTDLERVKMVVNLDLMGSAEKGIAVVNGKNQPKAVEILRAANRAADKQLNIKVRDNAANSDHFPFTYVGVPAVFIYTEGNITAYHDVNDTPEVVDWANYPYVFRLITALIEGL
ncbi:MAG TPA: M28 family peptidase [Cryomorphaceae bacterium]|nr:M28 family peptidase [Cryomorphaceae bacterium]